jgi:hypothetical protein
MAPTELEVLGVFETLYDLGVCAWSPGKCPFLITPPRNRLAETPNGWRVERRTQSDLWEVVGVYDSRQEACAVIDEFEIDERRLNRGDQ